MSVFVSNMEQFDEHIASGSKVTLLLGGELVYMTNDKTSLDRLQQEAGDRYILQAPRVASKGSIFDNKKEFLYVAVAKQAAEYSQSYRGQVLLAADHYLAYGLAQKKQCIVIGGGLTEGGGATGSHGINLEIFVFSDNRLVATIERTSAATTYMLELTLKDVIQNYPEHQILWCDPLGDPPLFDMASPDQFEVVGSAPIKQLIKRKLLTRAHGVEEPWGVLQAVAAALLGVTAFFAGASYQWLALESERNMFKEQVAGYETAYSNSAQSLDLLRHRAFLLESRPKAIDRVQMLEQLMATAAGIEGVVIHSVKVYDETDPEADGVMQSGHGGLLPSSRDDFRVELSIPQIKGTGTGTGTGAGARDLAEPIVAMLNNSTGMTIRVIDHASEVITSGESRLDYWRYQIGGGS